MKHRPLLEEGARSDEVKLLQSLLNRALSPSPKLHEDGHFGAATRKAVVAFQRREQLDADGIVGKMTWEKLHAHTGSEKPPTHHRPSAPGTMIRSSKLTVAGRPFATWYNEIHCSEHRGAHPEHPKYQKYPRIVSPAGLTRVLDNLGLLLRPELTLTELVALFMICCNETGGTFEPIAERGSPRYFFESKGKRSYNTLAGNRRAGDQLRERGILDDPAEINAWNGEVWPESSSEEVKRAALECDFHKYRGRGLIQTTGRRVYASTVDPLLEARGLPKCDELSDAALTEIIRTDERVFLPMVKTFFRHKLWQQWLAALNDDPPNFFDVGWHVSGGKDYGRLYEWRCKTLHDAILAAGFQAA